MKKLIATLTFIYLFSFSQAQIISTIAGNGICTSTGDGGLATAASMRWPIGITIDPTGNIYYVEDGSFVIRKINTSGVISRYAGNGTNGYSGDGGQATNAQIRSAHSLALDLAGNLYIAEAGKIRKVNSSGIISTVAGGLASLTGGDGGPATAAHLEALGGVYVDASGNIYFTDANRIRKVNTSGIISTIAGDGTAGYTGDGGPATTAQLYMPQDIKIDAAGNILIVETANNIIRKINVAGIISTIAGNGSPGYSGDGGAATAAQLKQPAGIALDRFGNIYIGDANNNVVRKVNAHSGIISTVVGNSIEGYGGDGGPATAATLDGPTQLAFDAHDNLYISVHSNFRIRRVGNISLSIPPTINIPEYNTSISPNPNRGNFIFKIHSENTQDAIVCIMDVTGKKLKEFTVVTNAMLEINVDLPDGIYILSAMTAENVVAQKLIVNRQ